MIFGDEAVAKLRHLYPTVWTYFGQFESFDNFEQHLRNGPWDVVESSLCWVMVQFLSHDEVVIHWFCPVGSDISALRRIFDHIFDSGVGVVYGEVPHGHVSERKSRTLGRALGFVRDEGVYVLTKERYRAYNEARKQRG